MGLPRRKRFSENADSSASHIPQNQREPDYSPRNTGPAPIEAGREPFARPVIARLPASQRIRVVLATRTLASYVPVWRATARALVELGCAAFFIGGVAWTSIGPVAPWAALAVVLVSLLVRTADVEARSLFVAGGLYGSVRETLGERLAIVSASALLVDRLMLGALAAVVTGHYLVAFGQRVVGVSAPS